jgi:hypothetical protein
MSVQKKRKAPSIVFMEEEAFSSLFSRTHAHRVCACGGKRLQFEGILRRISKERDRLKKTNKTSLFSHHEKRVLFGKCGDLDVFFWERNYSFASLSLKREMTMNEEETRCLPS